MNPAVDKYDFIFYPAVDIAKHHRQNYLLRELIKKLANNSKILLIERPIFVIPDFFRRNRLVFNSYGPKMKRFVREKNRFKKIGDNVYAYRPLLPFHEALSNILLAGINCKILTPSIKKILSKESFRHNSLITFVFHPYQLDYMHVLGPRIVVYDCYDDLLEPFTAKDTLKWRGNISRRERELIKKTDIVFTVSDELAKKKRMLNLNKHIYPITDGVDPDLFNILKYKDAPREIASIPSPRIGVHGHIDDKFDFILIDYLARRNPSWSIVLVGGLISENRSTKKMYKRLRTNKNIYFLGYQPHENMPKFIKEFDVCIIPLVKSEKIRTSSPIQLYECLATGKPIVSVDFPEVSLFKEVVRIGRTYQEFEWHISQALHEKTKDLSGKRIAIARDNSWENKAGRMVEIINSFL